MCQHKAPHRTFPLPLDILIRSDDVTIPEPSNSFDDYKNRSETLARNEMEIDRHFDWAYDAKVRKNERGDIKLPKPGPLRYTRVQSRTPDQKTEWDKHFGPRNQQFLADFAAGKLDHKGSGEMEIPPLHAQLSRHRKSSR